MAEQKAPQKKEDIKYFIRIFNTDLPGQKKIEHALTNVKGVGYTLAHATCVVAGIDSKTKAGALSDEAVAKLEQVLRNPIKSGIPSWMVNRQKDYDTGEDVHLVTTDLTLTRDNDIKRLRKIKSYKGLRHAKGLTVRGQRTKSNFRKNKGKTSLGVKRSPTAKAGKV